MLARSGVKFGEDIPLLPPELEEVLGYGRGCSGRTEGWGVFLSLFLWNHPSSSDGQEVFKQRN